VTRTIYLHAGLPKTGTTAIQSALALASRELRVQGILCPGFEANHSLPLRSLAEADQRPEGKPNKRVHHSGDVTWTQQAKWRAAIEDSLGAPHWDRLVFSGEGLSILPRARLETLRDRLSVKGDRIDVILMLRHPYDLRVSQIQQSLKAGGVITEELRKHAEIGYFAQVVNRMAGVFGTDHLHVVIYDEAVAAGGLLGSFAALIGADAGTLEARVQKKNPRMSGRAAAVIDRLNREVPNHVGGRRNRARSLWVDRAIRRIPGGPFILTAAEGEMLRAAVEEDRRFADGWLGRQVWVTGVPDDLPDVARQEPPGAMLAALKVASRVLW
jgi:hypothetical protein